ncbi:MAG: AbrB family transcriptional regulator [Candidatus Levybacteria bacterium]|nr:AbrB family transcriptional regulator [Candidatus Levybacteria bacterium]
MQLITICPKSQVVIPKHVRNLIPELKPGKKVTVRALDARSVIVELPSADWVTETHGMHAKIWKGIDATSYIHKLRSQWAKIA